MASFQLLPTDSLGFSKQDAPGCHELREVLYYAGMPGTTKHKEQPRYITFVAPDSDGDIVPVSVLPLGYFRPIIQFTQFGEPVIRVTYSDNREGYIAIHEFVTLNRDTLVSDHIRKQPEQPDYIDLLIERVCYECGYLTTQFERIILENRAIWNDIHMPKYMSAEERQHYGLK